MANFQYYTGSWQPYAYPTYAGQTYSINLAASVQNRASGVYINNGLSFLSENNGYNPGTISSFDAYDFYISTLTVIYH